MNELRKAGKEFFLPLHDQFPVTPTLAQLLIKDLADNDGFEPLDKGELILTGQQFRVGAFLRAKRGLLKKRFCAVATWR